MLIPFTTLLLHAHLLSITDHILHIHRVGIPVIPKSASAKHQTENIDLFSWELSAADMKTLTTAAQPAVSGGGDGKTSGDCGIL
jgi:diketogulonate reductase-like aldo/keto reductase